MFCRGGLKLCRMLLVLVYVLYVLRCKPLVSIVVAIRLSTIFHTFLCMSVWRFIGFREVSAVYDSLREPFRMSCAVIPGTRWSLCVSNTGTWCITNSGAGLLSVTEPSTRCTVDAFDTGTCQNPRFYYVMLLGARHKSPVREILSNKRVLAAAAFYSKDSLPHIH